MEGKNTVRSTATLLSAGRNWLVGLTAYLAWFQGLSGHCFADRQDSLVFTSELLVLRGSERESLLSHKNVCGSQALIIFRADIGTSKGESLTKVPLSWTEYRQSAKLPGTPETLVSSHIQAIQASPGLTNLLLFTNVNNIDQGAVSSLLCGLAAQEHFYLSSALCMYLISYIVC